MRSHTWNHCLPEQHNSGAHPWTKSTTVCLPQIFLSRPKATLVSRRWFLLRLGPTCQCSGFPSGPSGSRNALQEQRSGIRHFRNLPDNVLCCEWAGTHVARQSPLYYLLSWPKQKESLPVLHCLLLGGIWHGHSLGHHSWCCSGPYPKSTASETSLAPELDQGLQSLWPGCHSKLFGAPGHFNQSLVELTRIQFPPTGAKDTSQTQWCSKYSVCEHQQNFSLCCALLWQNGPGFNAKSHTSFAVPSSSTQILSPGCASWG